MIAVIFDLETTGLVLPSVAEKNKQPRIIEFGAMAIDENYVVRRELSKLINPEISISEDITKITKLTNADLADKPTFNYFVPFIQDFFSGADLLLAHNAPFDIEMMRNELTRVGVRNFTWPNMMMCTAEEYHHRMGFTPHMKDLYERIVGVPLKQTHRALDDCRALFEILKKDDFLSRIIEG
jgi:DNA polymerase III epsilon subunit-like protein